MKTQFIKVRTTKDITIFTSLILIGAILIALPTQMGATIAGATLAIIGIALIPLLKSGYRHRDSSETYRKLEHYFQQTKKSSLTSAISSKPETIELPKEQGSNALRLDIYFSRSANKAFVQLFEYVPYEYEPCTEIYEYEASRVENLIK
jgi:hypothetical protein